MLHPRTQCSPDSTVTGHTRLIFPAVSAARGFTGWRELDFLWTVPLGVGRWLLRGQGQGFRFPERRHTQSPSCYTSTASRLCHLPAATVLHSPFLHRVLGRDIGRIELKGLIKDLGSQKFLTPRHFLLSSHDNYRGRAQLGPWRRQGQVLAGGWLCEAAWHILVPLIRGCSRGSPNLSPQVDDAQRQILPTKDARVLFSDSSCIGV